VLNLHPLCVLVSFPHASAETSKTDSNLSVGFVYGFFAVACWTWFSLEDFSVLNVPSP
jgi:hypothetical protein